MAKDRLHKILHKGLLTLAIVTAAFSGLGGVQTASAATSYTLNSLSATVNGASVSATANVKASVNTLAQYAGICVRNASDTNFDFTKSSNITVTTAGTTLNGAQKTFATGTYTYFVCLQVQNSWYQAGASKTFTVGGTTTPTDPETPTTPTTPTQPPVTLPVTNNALARWNSALANRATTPATWVAWGDSFTEGQGASSIQNRWVNKTLTNLRTTHPTTGVTGGLGYLPSFYATYGPDSTWQPYTTMGGSGIWDETGASLGNRLVKLNKNAYTTYTVTGTSVDILYTKGGGTFTYKVDSGSAVSVNTSGTSSPANSVRVTFPSAGSHKVTITSTTATVYFQGIVAYNGDENKGIRLFEAGHSGATTDDFVATGSSMAKITNASKADLVTIELGANDFLRGSKTPSGVTTNLQNLVSAIRQNSVNKQPSIVIVVPWSFAGFSSPTGYSWQQYADAIRAVATADTTLGLLDLTTVGTANGTGGGLFAPDGLHPSDAGQTAISTRVATYLANQ